MKRSFCQNEILLLLVLVWNGVEFDSGLGVVHFVCIFRLVQNDSSLLLIVCSSRYSDPVLLHGSKSLAKYNSTNRGRRKLEKNKTLQF